MISQQMEEYLEAIGKLEERGEAVTTTALARECKVAPPTVTEMLHRLREQGLIDYEPRKEIALTEAGRQLSTSVIRRHRLWERFLHDVLGLKWDRVHDEACQLEHATSPDLERELARAVGDAETCPHGHAIRTGEQRVSAAATVPLAQVPPGTTVRVVSVSEEGALLRRLAALHLKPGTVARVEAPDDEGALVLTAAGEREVLRPGEAERVAVVPLTGPEALEAPGVLPLGELKAGSSARVHGFRGGRGLVGRCLALGFTPGVAVRMLQNVGHGPVIVLVRDTRVALGRGEAERIMVTRGEDGDAEAN